MDIDSSTDKPAPKSKNKRSHDDGEGDGGNDASKRSKRSADQKRSRSKTDALGDQGLLDLLTVFADLEVKDDDGKERCLLCPRRLPLPEFAKHVYECINERAARDLAGAEGDLAMTLEFEVSEECADGAACKRRDANHFACKKHPPVQCPLCARSLALVDMNAHLDACSPPASASADGGASTTTSGTSLSAMDIGAVEIKSTPAPAGDVSASAMATTTAMPQLNIAQLSAISKMILHKAHSAEQEAKDEEEDGPSVLDMLESFKTLGFNKDALSTAKVQLDSSTAAASETVGTALPTSSSL